MLLVVYQSCVPNTDHGVTLMQDMAQHPYRKAQEKGSVYRIGLVLARKREATFGSKTCNGLTYLELGLVDIPWLLRVSSVIGRGEGLRIPSWIP
jgi:hypothetical protein